MASPEIPKTYEVPDGDYSGQFLDTLLGSGWDTFGTGAFGGGAASELMLQIFSAFNLVALATISSLFIWVSIIGVIGTAHEGTAFGKKYSSVWMPIRFVATMGGLAPIFKGLSLFQIAILAVLGWSINLGNFVWTIGTDYFLEHGGQMTVQAPTYPTQNFNDISNGILKSLTLQEYLANRRQLDIPGRPGQWAYSENLFTEGGKATFNFAGSLGKISIDCVQESDSMCSAKKNAVTTAINSLQSIAAALANPDTDASSVDQAGLYNSAQAVNNSLLSGLQAKASESGSQLNSKLQAFKSFSEDFGWFGAGASYWAISWINQETRDAMYGGFAYAGPSISEAEINAMTTGLLDYPAIMLRCENYINSGYGAKRGIPDAASDPDVSGDSGIIESAFQTMRSWCNKFFAPIFSKAVELLASQDPIAALSSIGDYCLGAAWGLLTALGGLSVGAMAADNLSAFGVGIKSASTTVGPYVSFLLFAVLLPLSIYAISLAFFLPAIPFIRWMAGLGAWVILLVESLIAAPLWLAAHALPEGDGAAGQHGKRGYMLLLGVMIRPPLMVAGFFAAVLLMNVMGRLVGEIFLYFVAGASQTKMVGLVGSVSMLIILGIVVMMLANRFFSLIQHLPDHVINWIGQQFHNLGEKEDASRAQSSFGGSTSAVSSAGSDGKQAAKGHFDRNRPQSQGEGGGGGNPSAPSGPSMSSGGVNGGQRTSQASHV